MVMRQAKSSLGVLHGTVDLLVLQALAAGPLHGYAVARWVKSASRDALDLEDRVLYLALHRLEARKLLRGRTRTTASGRQAKEYELTAAGRRRLETHTSEWKRYVRAMGWVLRAAGGR